MEILTPCIFRISTKQNNLVQINDWQTENKNLAKKLASEQGNNVNK